MQQKIDQMLKLLFVYRMFLTRPKLWRTMRVPPCEFSEPQVNRFWPSLAQSSIQLNKVHQAFHHQIQVQKNTK